MKAIATTILTAVSFAATALADGGDAVRMTQDNGEAQTGWRLSVGAEVRPSVKAKFRFVPSLYNAGKAAAVSSSYKSQGAAASSASKGNYDNGYVHADSGNLADPNEGSCMAVSAIEGDNAAEHKRESRLFRLS